MDKSGQSSIEQDKRAFKELYEMISGKMYSLCLRYTGNKHDANEAFHEGLLRLYRGLGEVAIWIHLKAGYEKYLRMHV